VAEAASEGVPDDRRSWATPLHPVSIRAFALGRFEVTRAEFTAFVRESAHQAGTSCVGRGDDGKWIEQPGRTWREPGFPQSERDPVVCVSWNDAKAYVAWLSSKTGKSYRLPSEAEWEYAARAGTTTARPWGQGVQDACAHANVADQSAKELFAELPIHGCRDGHAFTSPVASYRANAFGVHDMIGNVEEWVEDCWNYGYEGAPSDGGAWTSGVFCNRRIQRGGAWHDGPARARSGHRWWNLAGGRDVGTGFRVARTD